MRYFVLLLVLSLSFLGCGHSQDMNEDSSKTKSAKVQSVKQGKKRQNSTRNQGAPSEPNQEDGPSGDQDDEESGEFLDDDNEPNIQLETEEDARTLIVGIWRMDGKSLPASDDILRLPQEQQAAALAEERSRAGMVYREFAEDGTYKLFLGGQSKQVGRYEILSAKHNVLEVETNSVGPAGSMTENLNIEVNSKELKVTDDQSRRFRMLRPSSGFGR